MGEQWVQLAVFPVKGSARLTQQQEHNSPITQQNHPTIAACRNWLRLQPVTYSLMSDAERQRKALTSLKVAGAVTRSKPL